MSTIAAYHERRFAMYEEKMKHTLAKLLQTKSAEEATEEAVSELFGKALEDSKKAGINLESVVYEMLEGIESALRDSGNFRESYLKRASEQIVEIIHKDALKRLACEEHRMHTAQHRFNEVLASEESSIRDSVESLRHYASERGHSRLFARLKGLEMNAASRLSKMAERFGYNRYVKLHKKRTPHYDQ